MQSSRSYPIEGIDAGSLGHLEYLLGDEETRRVRGGNQLIAERLAEGLDVRCGERVRSVRQTDAGVDVVTDSGTHAADACVVAVPVSIVLEIDFEPSLPSGHVEAIRALKFGAAAKLAAPLAEPVAPDAIMSTADRFWAYTTPCDEVGGRTLVSWAGAQPEIGRAHA